MTTGMGYDSWGSVVEEAEYGTTPGTGETYFEIVSETMKREQDVKPRRSLRRVSPTHTFMGVERVGGDLTLEALFEGLGAFIKHGMGGYAFTADTPVADANTHTFTLGDTLPIGLSVEVSKGAIPTGKVFLYQGCKVNTLDFQFTEDDVMGLIVGLIAQSETSNTTASDTPTYPGDHPILWHYAGTLTLAGTASLAFKAGHIMLDNKLSADRFLMGSQIASPLRTDRRDVSGDFTIEFEDLALYDKFTTPTTGTLSLAFTSTEMVTGTTPYTITFTMPKVQLAGVTPQVGGEGPIEVTIPFISLHDGTSTDALTIVIVSGEATLGNT